MGNWYIDSLDGLSCISIEFLGMFAPTPVTELHHEKRYTKKTFKAEFGYTIPLCGNEFVLRDWSRVGQATS